LKAIPSTSSSNDIWFKKACNGILKLLSKIKVATERELKVRLEGEPFPGKPGPFPWIVRRALDYLIQEGKVKRHGYRGRRRIGKGVPMAFYSLAQTSYSEIEQLILIKRRISADISNVLTGEAPASFHAEDLFLDAFIKLDFKLHGRDVSEFKGLKVKSVNGKKPPDLDFVVERDGVIYGVDVKNWIRYEYGSRGEILHKVRLAKQLRLVPFIVARYIDREITNKVIYEHQGLVYEYKNLLLPFTMRSLAEDCKKYMGYPVLAVEELPEDMLKRLEDIHHRYLSKKGN